jgi:DNA polymerase V|tara:strand:+ start:715 stop:1968 length:1254 start_codon:yes stop_codon:yes gene_type:complete
MIFLVDCNNFYASCERIFRPDLQNIPIVVLSNNDGCIISRSSEAKDIGIKMGEPVFKIKNLIKNNNIHVFSSNFELYGEISKRIMLELKIFSSKIEVYSIDEAFMQIDNNSNLSALSQEIIYHIKKITGIPVSVGVSSTKTLSKIAVNFAKNKLNNTFILEEKLDIYEIVKSLDVKKIWGIGSNYSKYLYQNKIFTAYDFMNTNKAWIMKKMNINVLRTREELKGISCFPIVTSNPPKKTITVSRSFKNDIHKYLDLEKRISDYAFICSRKLRKEKLTAYSISIFIATNQYKYRPESNYYGFTSDNFLVSTNNYIDIVKLSNKLLRKIFKNKFSYKKGGVILSNLTSENSYQASYLKLPSSSKQDSLMNSIDYINNTFGSEKIKLASQNLQDVTSLSRKKLSPKYINSWNDIPNITI